MTAVEDLTYSQKWDYLYDALGIKKFIYFISSPELQHDLLPVKLVFIAFTIFFFVAVIYFYMNSSYLKYKFLEDTVELMSWQPYAVRQVSKRLQKILDRVENGDENEYKLAIVEADELLYKTMEDKGYEGETFEEVLENAKNKITPSYQEVLSAHNLRNSIVYEPDYKLDLETTKRILDIYEKAIKNL